MVQGVSNIPVLVKQEIPDDPAQLAVLVQEQGLQTSSSIYIHLESRVNLNYDVMSPARNCRTRSLPTPARRQLLRPCLLLQMSFEQPAAALPKPRRLQCYQNNK